MKSPLPTDSLQRERIESILRTSSLLPLAPIVALACGLYLLVGYLVETMQWVDHTDRVIAEAQELRATLLNQQAGLRGYLLTADETMLEPYRTGASHFTTEAEMLRGLLDDNPAQQQRLGEIREAVDVWVGEHAEPLIATRRRGEMPSTEAIQGSRLSASQAPRLIQELVDHERMLLASRREASRNATQLTLVAGLCAIALVAAMLVLFIRRQLASVSTSYANVLTIAAERTELVERNAESLANAVKVYGAHIERLARGDLGSVVEPVGDDELKTLGRNLRGLGESLSAMVQKMREAVANLSTSTAEIASTMQQQSASASESAAAVAQTVATVDQVAQSAQQAAERARSVADASLRSVEVSTHGRQAVERSIAVITSLRAQVGSIAEKILALSEQAQTVSQIITTVNELAEQSNLLALNASIEAARAGEHGRSFAVVAQEVRSLAEQSKAATAQVRSILGDIQKSTTAAVLVTEEGSKGAAAAVDAIRDVGTRIEQLSGTIDDASRAAQVIVSAAQQQVTGIAQISQAMHSINVATSHAVEGTRQTERASRELSEVASRLRDSAAQFRSS
ncbi:MAG: CHASE3 domain-containing protein [Sandaracinus sp.]